MLISGMPIVNPEIRAEIRAQQIRSEDCTSNCLQCLRFLGLIIAIPGVVVVAYAGVSYISNSHLYESTPFILGLIPLTVLGVLAFMSLHSKENKERAKGLALTLLMLGVLAILVAYGACQIHHKDFAQGIVHIWNNTIYQPDFGCGLAFTAGSIAIGALARWVIHTIEKLF